MLQVLWQIVSQLLQGTWFINGGKTPCRCWDSSTEEACSGGNPICCCLAWSETHQPVRYCLPFLACMDSINSLLHSTSATYVRLLACHSFHPVYSRLERKNTKKGPHALQQQSSSSGIESNIRAQRTASLPWRPATPPARPWAPQLGQGFLCKVYQGPHHPCRLAWSAAQVCALLARSAAAAGSAEQPLQVWCYELCQEACSAALASAGCSGGERPHNCCAVQLQEQCSAGQE